MFGFKIYRMVDFLSLVNTVLIASSHRNEVIYEKLFQFSVKLKIDNIKSSVPTWHKKQIKLQNSHLQKQQMGYLITRCPAFILLERSIWGCSLAPKGTIRRYRIFKWLEILSLQQSFLTPCGRLEKQKQQNEYSNKGKKHINRSYYISMNVNEHLSGFFVKNYLESFYNATNLSASIFFFHCSDYDFR